MKRNQLPGGVVSAVEPGGLAAQMGLRPGDVIVAVNGYPLRDVIDFRFYSAEEEVELEVRRDGQELTLSGLRAYGQPVGVEFAHPTFDVDIRRCTNKCEFCFVTQSPRGMRRTVYIKDDDYRYSFLFGHFVTLTNLSEADWERVEEQHLSPLYVSVHATELELRRKLLAKASAPDVLEQLRWLGERAIEVHTQLVLIPGLNDGLHLERSLGDLAGLYPTVQSVSVVPIGLTRYHPGTMRSFRPDEAGPILDQIEPWRKRCRRELGVTFVYPSDEWYLLAGRPLPPAAHYDGFGQTENGVGMVRQFLDEWEEVKGLKVKGQRSKGKGEASNTKRPRPVLASGPESQGGQTSNRQPLISNLQPSTFNLLYPRAILACGELAAPVLRRVVDELNGLAGSAVRLAPILNNWYGVVTVSGLLTGHDVVEQLAGSVDPASPGAAVVLPRVMFDNSGRVTLDDMTPEDIQAALGVPVLIAQHPGEMLAALRGELAWQAVLAPKPGWWGEQNRPFWQAMGEIL
jgi:putative radical SAM enzyme (TIGR03279 family)